MSYKVLIIVKDEWYSDNKELATFAAAQRHRKSVALRWNDCDTAILMPDGRVAAHQDSVKFQIEAAQ